MYRLTRPAPPRCLLVRGLSSGLSGLSSSSLHVPCLRATHQRWMTTASRPDARADATARRDTQRQTPSHAQTAHAQTATPPSPTAATPAPAPASMPSSSSTPPTYFTSNDMLTPLYPIRRFFQLAKHYQLAWRRDQQHETDGDIARVALVTMRAPVTAIPASRAGRSCRLLNDEELVRPTSQALARLAVEYARIMREQLPQFDPERAHLKVATPRQPITFQEYAGATQMMIRVATENPPQMYAGEGAAAPLASSPVLTDPLYPLTLLQQYCRNVSSPASPFERTWAPTLQWWQMQTAQEVLIGTLSRPAADRAAVIDALLTLMRATALAPQPGIVDGMTGSLYDYASRHEQFMRLLLHARIHAQDLPGALQLLPLVPQLGKPSRDSVKVWKPIPRVQQYNMFANFMANCAARIHVTAAAKDGNSSGSLPSELQQQLTQATLKGLSRDMDLYVELARVEMEHPAISGCAAASSSSSSSTSSSSPTPTPLALLHQSFRTLTGTHLPLLIDHYNYFLYALATWPSDAGSPEAASQYTTITQIVGTILSERIVGVNQTTLRILIQYCLRDATEQGTISTDKLALLQLIRAHFEELLRANATASKAKRLRMLTCPPLAPLDMQLWCHALYAQTRTAAAAVAGAPPATADQLGDALLSLHAQWLPLLRAPATVELWHQTVLHELVALDSWPTLERFMSEHGAELPLHQLTDMLERMHSPALFASLDQWVAAQSAEGAETDAYVGEFQLRWAKAKSALSEEKYTLLSSASPSAPLDLSAFSNPSIPRVLPAANFLIFHARRSLVEPEWTVTRPFTAPSLYRPPPFALPPAVLSAQNVSTAWLLICSAWAQHLPEQAAMKNIQEAMRVLADAALGSNEGEEKQRLEAVERQAQEEAQRAAELYRQQQAAAAAHSTDGTATVRSSRWLHWVGVRYEPDAVAPSSDASSSSSSSSPPPPVAPLTAPSRTPLLDRWFGGATRALVTDFSHSLSSHVVNTPLLEANIPFQLSPVLLQNTLHALTFYESKFKLTAQWWNRIFKRLAPYMHMFDLSQHDPRIVRLFQCDDVGDSYLDLLATHPITEWPSQLSHLARIWNPLEPLSRNQGQRLLTFLIERTQTNTDAQANEATEQSNTTADSAHMTQEQFVQCILPFLRQMETRGHLLELQEWMRRIEVVFPGDRSPLVLSRVWPLVYACVQSNFRLVTKLVAAQPEQESRLKEHGFVDLEEAKAWRIDFRQRHRLPHAHGPVFAQAQQALASSK